MRIKIDDAPAKHPMIKNYNKRNQFENAYHCWHNSRCAGKLRIKGRALADRLQSTEFADTMPLVIKDVCNGFLLKVVSELLKKRERKKRILMKTDT
ncbi:hypothetical protein NPIL_611441 [Nephila pilipes]|uniref:Uncharacterized protein n=1 Tax=Nephila pilipes TaxID=299642 RepID=A0A8X6MNG4_NEPPI|nr:hypothetical protein NPIL_611441 [Nephila pilipes]